MKHEFWLVDPINKILHEVWDPIGMGVPDDEYRLYAEKIAEMIDIFDPTEVDIAEFLINVTEQWMGMTWLGLDADCNELDVARLILALLDD